MAPLLQTFEMLFRHPLRCITPSRPGAGILSYRVRNTGHYSAESGLNDGQNGVSEDSDASFRFAFGTVSFSGS